MAVHLKSCVAFFALLIITFGCGSTDEPAVESGSEADAVNRIGSPSGSGQRIVYSVALIPWDISFIYR